MSDSEIRNFIFENYYNGVGFSKKNNYYSMKRLKKKDLLFLATKSLTKIPDSHKAKEHYQSFLRTKKTKSVKQ